MAISSFGDEESIIPVCAFHYECSQLLRDCDVVSLSVLLLCSLLILSGDG